MSRALLIAFAAGLVLAASCPSRARYLLLKRRTKAGRVHLEIRPAS